MRAILTYHSLDRTGSVISVAPEVFREHVEWLARSGVRVVGLAEILAWRDDGDAVALTFDDGFANFASAAWPLLEAHGMAVTVFVPAAHVGGENGWESGSGGVPVLPLLDWAALARLAEQGVTLGSHGLKHPDLRAAGDSELAEEIAGSAQRIRAETGRDVRTFAYPYGLCDDRVVRLVRTRYEAAVTTELRLLKTGEDACRLPRLDMYYLREPGRLERWGTSGFRRYLALRRRLRRARSFFNRGLNR
jgi:peptidoglycan/xylan/chitin deacetylase (PgdA/CDA1 family)